MELMDLLDTFFCFWHLSRKSTVLGGQLESRVVAIRDVERAASKCFMLALHVGKFCHRKEFGPVVLLFAAVYTEVVFQSLVLPLSLSIDLWVKRSTQLTLYFHAVAYL